MHQVKPKAISKTAKRQKRKRGIYVEFIILFLLLNSLSFVAIHMTGHSGAKLEVIREAKPGERMNYLIAGLFNQPRKAYEKLWDEMEGGVTLVTFRATGWRPLDMARDVANDIKQHERTARVYTISVGDQVGRYLNMFRDNDTQVIAINPCGHSSLLKSGQRKLSALGTVLCYLVSYLLGWFSLIPCLPGGYSLPLLADQFLQLLDYGVPQYYSNVAGLVLSSEDECLENNLITETYTEREQEPITTLNEVVRLRRASALPEVHCIVIPTKHGDTIGAADEYRAALGQLDESLGG